MDEGINEGGSYGPYRQSDRKKIYRQYADKLISAGCAYYAFDTPEELEQLRTEAEKDGKTFIYNASVRNNLHNSLSLKENVCREKIEKGEPYVIRFKMPLNEDIHFEDLIRGRIVVNTNTLDDKVLFKSDGMPTYHLANIVDDYLMEITHVIRGEEWFHHFRFMFTHRSFGWKAPNLHIFLCFSNLMEKVN